MSTIFPWNDRRGQFSWIRLATFIGILLPAAWIVYEFETGRLGPRPRSAATHYLGLWAIRFLFMSLAVTPLRRIFDWTGLGQLRRMLGLTTLAYASTHIVLYASDLHWDLVKVLSEIALRFYLVIGAIALIGLTVLGATSNDAALRRLGRNWKPVHRASYAIALLAVLHFIIQSKIDTSQAFLMAGLFFLLMGYRAMLSNTPKAAMPRLAAITAILATIMTAAAEYVWVSQATGLSSGRVLMSYLSFPAMIRPAYWVLFTGVGIAALAYASRWLRKRPDRGPIAPR